MAKKSKPSAHSDKYAAQSALAQSERAKIDSRANAAVKKAEEAEPMKVCAQCEGNSPAWECAALHGTRSSAIPSTRRTTQLSTGDIHRFMNDEMDFDMSYGY